MDIVVGVCCPTAGVPLHTFTPLIHPSVSPFAGPLASPVVGVDSTGEQTDSQTVSGE